MHVRALVVVIFAMLCGLPASASQAQQADQPPPPAPYCFNAREVREARQSDLRTLAVRLNDESRYRIELADACPDALWSDRPQLVSRHGWICGNNAEYVDLGDRQCAIAGLARIDAREYADHVLRSQRRASGDANVLDRVEVRGQRRRGFAGTTSTCVDTRYMRGWRDEGSDIVVEMSPKRSGGNRYYRVELGGQCTEMGSMNHMRLESAIGGNVVCGNSGDRAMFFREDSSASEPSPFQRRINENGLAARFGCSVSRVYPLLPEDEARNAGKR
jgi:hypothetical protein